MFVLPQKGNSTRSVTTAQHKLEANSYYEILEENPFKNITVLSSIKGENSTPMSTYAWTSLGLGGLSRITPISMVIFQRTRKFIESSFIFPDETVICQNARVRKSLEIFSRRMKSLVQNPSPNKPIQWKWPIQQKGIILVLYV